MDYQTYVGPYIRCEVYRVDVEHVLSGVCVNDRCWAIGKPSVLSHRETKKFGRPDSNVAQRWSDPKDQPKFCPACGTALGSTTVKSTEENVLLEQVEGVDGCDRPRLDRMHGDSIEYKLEKDGVHIWLPVEVVPHIGKFESRQDAFVQEITSLQVGLEIERVEQKYAKDLEDLREIYGDGKVTIKWGVLAWAN